MTSCYLPSKNHWCALTPNCRAGAYRYRPTDQIPVRLCAPKVIYAGADGAPLLSRVFISNPRSVRVRAWPNSGLTIIVFSTAFVFAAHSTHRESIIVLIEPSASYADDCTSQLTWLPRGVLTGERNYRRFVGHSVLQLGRFPRLAPPPMPLVSS